MEIRNISKYRQETKLYSFDYEKRKDKIKSVTVKKI